ncbi:MAG: hypothetical protein QFX33_01190 [Candidatus Nezhaarchaeota archaeon]|nr:hypothetical protein [Candidatus Nezhaarchaeota archaeon]
MIILLSAYLLPYTLFSLRELAAYTYFFWCIDALVAIGLMFYMTREWRDQK